MSFLHMIIIRLYFTAAFWERPPFFKSFLLIRATVPVVVYFANAASGMADNVIHTVSAIAESLILSSYASFF